MSRLSRTIRTATRQATLFDAKVIAVSGNRATVRLSSNGTIYRSLVVYGGQVVPNQVVKVDMTSDQPFVIAPAKPSEPAISTDLLPATPKAKAADPPTLEQIIVDVNNPPKTTVPLPDEDADIYGYPATDDGLRDALDLVQNNGTIYIPAGTYDGIIVGSMTSGSGTGYYRENLHIVGAGIDQTIFSDTVNTVVPSFLYDFTVEFTKNDSNNYSGLYIQHNTTCERIKTRISNTGAGLALGAYTDMELHFTVNGCDILGDDYGIYLATSLFNLHYEYEAKYEYLGGSSTNPVDFNNNTGEVTWYGLDITGQPTYYSDGAIWGVVTAKPQLMSGKEIHIIYEITSGSTTYSPPSNPHSNEDMSYWVDDYGQTIPAEILAGNQMSASDESYVEYINGTSGSSPYGAGDFIKWVWTNPPDFEAGIGTTYNSIWFAIRRLVENNKPGKYQKWKLNRAYILNPDGSKENISPVRTWCYARESKFSGNTYDIFIGTYATVEHIYCLFDTVSNFGSIVELKEGQPPVYYGDEPLATYPGMLWIEE